MCIFVDAASQQIKANRKQNPITSDYLRDFGCILAPGVNCRPCHLELNTVWIYLDTLGLIRAWKSAEGDPAGTDLEVVLRPPRPPHLLLSLPTEHLRRRCPKKTLATLFISPPGFLSSSSCQLCLVSGQEKGGRLRIGRPDPAESLLTRSLFSAKSPCESPPGSERVLRIQPQRPRLTFAQSPHVEYCEALFKSSSNNYNDKNSYAEFVHASSETMETKLWKNLTKKKKWK